MHFDIDVDARNLNCPLPLLRAKKALAQLEPGKIIRVQATDSGAAKDFEAFSRHTGHVLLKSQVLEDGVVEFYLERKADI